MLVFIKLLGTVVIKIILLFLQDYIFLCLKLMIMSYPKKFYIFDSLATNKLCIGLLTRSINFQFRGAGLKSCCWTGALARKTNDHSVRPPEKK